MSIDYNVLLLCIQTENTDQKLRDIALAVVDNTQELCRCGFVRDRISSEVFRCFPASPQAVTYRAVLHGTTNATSSQLISQIEQWTAEVGATITIQRILLEVDGSCVVAVSSLTDEECQLRNADLAKSSSNINIGAIIGGVAAALVILLLVFVLTVISVFLVRNHRTKRKPSQPNDSTRYVIVFVLNYEVTIFVLMTGYLNVLLSSQLLTLLMRFLISWTMSMKALTSTARHWSMRCLSRHLPQPSNHQLMTMS